MTSAQIRFFQRTFSGIRVARGAAGNRDAGMELIPEQRVQLLSGGQVWNELFVYIFCSAQCPQDFILKPNNPWINRNGRMFWLQEIINIDAQGNYRQIPRAGCEPAGGAGRSTSVPTELGVNNPIPIEHFFCISRVNFSETRVRNLLNELAGGNFSRLERIDFSQPQASGTRNSGNIHQVILTDRMAEAQWLHEKYIDYLNEYFDWVNDEKRSSLSTLSDLITTQKSGSGVDYRRALRVGGVFEEIPDFNTWRNENEKTEREMLRAAENYCIALMQDWIGNGLLSPILEDYSETEALQEKGERELARLLTAVDMFPVGRSTLHRMLNDRDSWIYRHIIGTQRLAVEDDITWSILILFANAGHGNRVEIDNIRRLTETINTRGRNLNIHFSVGEQPAGASAGQVQQRQGNVTNDNTDRNNRELVILYGGKATTIIKFIDNDGFPPVLKLLALIFDVYIFAQNNSENSRTPENRAAMARNIADFTVRAFSLGARKDTTRNIIGRRAGAIFSVISTISSISSMANAAAENNRAHAASHGLNAAANTFWVIRTVSGIFVPNPGTVLKAIAGWKFLVVIIGTAIIAEIIIRRTQRTPFETWLRNSIWGTEAQAALRGGFWDRRAVNLGISKWWALNGREKKLRQLIEIQTIDLQQIVHHFDVDVSRPQNTVSFNVSVETNSWLEGQSGLYVYVWRQNRLGIRTNMFNVMVERPDRTVDANNTSTLGFNITNSTFGANVSRGNVIEVNNLISDHNAFGVSLFCTVFMDIFGDGGMVIPFNKELSQWIENGKPNKRLPVSNRVTDHGARLR